MHFFWREKGDFGCQDTEYNIIPVVSGAKRKSFHGLHLPVGQKVLCAFACSLLAPMDSICVKYVEHLVFTEQKSHRQISEILKSKYPNRKGLSERSVRRFCKDRGISKRANLSDESLDDMVKESVRKVSTL